MWCSERRWPETPTTGWCCEGTAYRDAASCTCWVADYDLEQSDDLQLQEVTSGRAQMCPDCAFRPGSPERLGDPGAASTQEDLDDLVGTATPFWCHQGMRRVTRWRHPSGMTLPGSALAYQPPMADGRPYQADGTPGQLCAGWAARCLRLAKQHAAR